MKYKPQLDLEQKIRKISEKKREASSLIQQNLLSSKIEFGANDVLRHFIKELEYSQDLQLAIKI